MRENQLRKMDEKRKEAAAAKKLAEEIAEASGKAVETGGKPKGEEDDPVAVIQELIRTAHGQLTADVDEMMCKYENDLRVQIKEVLRQYSPEFDTHPTPLTSLKEPGAHRR